MVAHTRLRDFIYSGTFTSGPLGIGTVIATFSYGPIIEWMMKTFPFNAATLYQKTNQKIKTRRLSYSTGTKFP